LVHTVVIFRFTHNFTYQEVVKWLDFIKENQP